MRFNHRATLRYGLRKKYDPKVGRQVESYDRELNLPCHLSDLGLEKSATIYGSVNIGRKVARFRQPVTSLPSQILIDGRPYEVDHVRLSGSVLYVKEAT
mgnify:FL=1